MEIIDQNRIYPCVCLRYPGDKVKIEESSEIEF